MKIVILFEAGLVIAVVGLMWSLLRSKKEFVSKLIIAMSGFLGATLLTQDYAGPVTAGTILSASLVIIALVAPLFTGELDAEARAKDLRQ